MQAQQQLIEEVLSALRNHPALWAYDLGERLSSLYQGISIDFWRRWLHKTIEEIRRWDSSTPVTLGLQPADLLEPGGLEPRVAAEVCDFLSMACLTRDTPWARGLRDPVVGLFLAELTSYLTSGKPVWVSAIGIASTPCKPEASSSLNKFNRLSMTKPAVSEQLVRGGEAEQYARLSMECLRHHDMPGALWWCYSDYPNARGQAPFVDYPLEASYGLVGQDWRPKQVLSGLQAVGRKRIPERPDAHWMDVEPEQYWRAPREHIQRLYERFRDQIPWSRY